MEKEKISNVSIEGGEGGLKGSSETIESEKKVESSNDRREGGGEEEKAEKDLRVEADETKPGSEEKVERSMRGKEEEKKDGIGMGESDGDRDTKKSSEAVDEEQKLSGSSIPIPSDLSSSTSKKKHQELSNETLEPSSSSAGVDPNQLSEPVRQLLSMFPQIGPSIIEAVLAAHNGDSGACITDLLSMSDPSYQPTQQEKITQTDEELARQLDYQERQQEQNSQSSILQQQQQQQQFKVPYQPRIRRNPSSQKKNQFGNEHSNDLNHSRNNSVGSEDFNGKDEIQKITDELSKLAETGKKTMSTWLNKAKMKMQEIQQQTQSPTNSTTTTTTTMGAAHDQNLNVTSPTGRTDLPSQESNLNNKRSTRISPALPYANRYETSNNRLTNSNNNQNKNSNAEGKSVSSSGLVAGGGAAALGVGGGALGLVGSGMINKSDGQKVNKSSEENDDQKLVSGIKEKSGVELGGNGGGFGKVRDDDEESLEYTRNPFEDDD